MTAKTPPKISIAERRAATLRLRAEGKTLAQIASELGISVPTASRDITTAIREICRPDAEEIIAVQRRIIDDIRSAVYAKATRGNLGAIDRLIRTMEHEAKLFGIYAPARVDVGLDGVDFEARERELLAQIAASQAELSAQSPDALP